MHFVYRLKQLILISGDLGSFFIGLWLALSIRNLSTPSAEYYIEHLPQFIWIFLFWVIVNFINGIFDLAKVRHTFAFYRRFIETAVASLLVGVIFFYVVPITILTPKTILLLTVLFGYGSSLLWRIFYIHAFGKHRLQTKILFVGYKKEVGELIDIIKAQPEQGYVCGAVIDPDNIVNSNDINGAELYHTLKTIRPAISTHDIKLVVIAPHLREDEDTLRELYELLFWSVQVTDLSSFYQLITGRIPPSTFSEGWFLDHLKNHTQPAYNSIRRISDYIGGVILSITFLLLFIPIAIAIKVNSKGPVLYTQNRVGEKGRKFKIYKFRSMYSLGADGGAEVGDVQFAKKGDKRITKVGGILRKTRLDELPQFINLLKGDVTIIGPRPERPEIVEKLEEKMPYYNLRHVIKPGISGWAQVNQHYTDNLETSLQKLQYDLYYIKNRSFLLDLSIMLRTVNVLFRLMGQ